MASAYVRALVDTAGERAGGIVEELLVDARLLGEGTPLREVSTC
jgi:hypothetical protein